MSICMKCGKSLKDFLPRGIALMRYSKSYIKKMGYDGIEVLLGGSLVEKYGVYGVFCLDCFSKLSREHGFSGGEREEDEEDEE